MQFQDITQQKARINMQLLTDVMSGLDLLSVETQEAMKKTCSRDPGGSVSERTRPPGERFRITAAQHARRRRQRAGRRESNSILEEEIPHG